MSGAKQTMQALSVNANNLANAKTTGFKADLAQARSMQAFGEGAPTRVFTATERVSQNFDSGAMLHTGRDLDMAIEGEGWFAVQSADGSEGYTRNGHFRLNNEGGLETNNGEPVMGEGGPIIIPLPVQNIEIARDGSIMIQPEGAPVTEQDEVDRIKMVNPIVRDLEKGSDGLFRRKDGLAEGVNIEVQVNSGMIESSNVSAVSEMTDMIALQRRFEMNLKLMKTAEEVDTSAASLLRAF